MKYTCPFPRTHAAANTMTWGTNLFRSTISRWSSTSVRTPCSPHVAILVTDGWIQIVLFLLKKTCFVLHFLKNGTLHFHFLCEYSKLDRVKPMGTPGRINAIWWNIKINSTKTGSCVQIWIANKYAEFHTKKPNPSENTVKSFKGATLFWITLYVYVHSNHKHNQQSYKHKPCKWS